MRLFSRKPEASPGFTRETPLPKQRGFWEMSQSFIDRQASFPETNQNHVSFAFAAPVLINLMADLHVGHASVNYKRIEQETEAIIKTANSYVILAGDLIDNMSWNPGQFEEMEQTPQQIAFLRSLLQYLASNHKLLHSIQGDHDGWLTKAGMNINDEILALGASVSNGPTYFNMKVENQQYALAGAHQLPGHSIYNRVHPQMRAARFGSMHGADVIFSGHNHQKGVATSYTHEMGVPREVTYVALGPYKATDSWLAKKGFPAQQADEMFGVAVKFDGRTHEIVADMDIIRANSRHK